jgi:hypothetical protein
MPLAGIPIFNRSVRSLVLLKEIEWSLRYKEKRPHFAASSLMKNPVFAFPEGA